MNKENTALRLRQLMRDRDLRQVDILNLTKPYCEKYDAKMNKSNLSQYVSGTVEPNQEKLALLGMALNVNEAWLMGYDVPMDRYDGKITIDTTRGKPLEKYTPQEVIAVLETIRRSLENSMTKQSIDIVNELDGLFNSMTELGKAVLGDYGDELVCEYSQLNKEGKKEAVTRVRDLTYNPNYKANKTIQK